MDPQKLSQLDPKLRDAYQRVMGTPIPTPGDTSAPAQAPLSGDTSSTPPTFQPEPEPTPAPEPQPESTPTPNIEPPIQPEPTFPPQSESESSIPQPPVAEPQPVISPEPQVPPVTEPTPGSTATPAQSTSNFTQMNSELPNAPSQNFATPPMPQAQTMTVKKKNGIMMPILFVIVGLVFLVIYTFFWTKIFNFKLPFLP